MTPVLLLPAALAALAALAIPLLIHLARRTEQHPIDFAALRWLRERPRPRHRPRLDEWPLLLVRLLLLALLALWLARPAVFGAEDTRAVLAVVPGTTALPTPAERAIWLAPGFPTLTDPRPKPGATGGLLRQLDADLPPGARLRVAVPATLQGVDGERPRLSRAVRWEVAPGAMPTAVPPPSAAFAVRSDARWLRAAAASLGQRDSAPPAQPLAPTTRALVWTAPGPLPAPARALLDRGGTLLVAATTSVEGVARPVPGRTWVESIETPRGRLLRFTRALTPAAFPELLGPAFPRQLADLLAPPRPPARVLARDYAPTAGVAPYPRPARDLRPWLGVAIAALFLLERLLATRRRGVTP